MKLLLVSLLATVLTVVCGTKTPGGENECSSMKESNCRETCESYGQPFVSCSWSQLPEKNKIYCRCSESVITRESFPYGRAAPEDDEGTPPELDGLPLLEVWKKIARYEMMVEKAEAKFDLNAYLKYEAKLIEEGDKIWKNKEKGETAKPFLKTRRLSSQPYRGWRMK